MITRRAFGLGMIACASVPGSLSAQLQSFKLTIRRDVALAGMQSVECITGKIYDTSRTTLTDVQNQLGVTLELPDRNNYTCIAAVPPGTYAGEVKTEGKLGWRIRIIGVPNRTDVVVHIGKQDEDTFGCIIVGETFSIREVLPRREIKSGTCTRDEITTGRALKDTCHIEGASKVISNIRARYGKHLKRPIEIRIVN